MYALRARPLYRATHAAVDTNGQAFQVQTTDTRPVKVHQVVVSSDGLGFVGIGVSSTPPAPTTSNTAYLEAGQPYVLTLDGNDALERYVYVYAASGTVLVRLSMFG